MLVLKEKKDQTIHEACEIKQREKYGYLRVYTLLFQSIPNPDKTP